MQIHKLRAIHLKAICWWGKWGFRPQCSKSTEEGKALGLSVLPLIHKSWHTSFILVEGQGSSGQQCRVESLHTYHVKRISRCNQEPGQREGLVSNILEYPLYVLAMSGVKSSSLIIDQLVHCHVPDKTIITIQSHMFIKTVYKVYWKEHSRDVS